MAQQRLVVDRVDFDRRCGPVVGHDHVPHAWRQRHPAEAREQRAIDHQYAVARVPQQQCDRVARETRIDGVQDRAHAGHGEIELEVMLRIPGECRDTIAAPDAESFQAIGESGAALENGGVGRRDQHSNDGSSRSCRRTGPRRARAMLR